MKKLSIILLLQSGLAFGQSNGPGLFVDICRFNLPMVEAQYGQSKFAGSPYVEIHVAVAGNSLVFKQEAPEKYQANVNIDLYLYKLEGKDTLLVDQDNYNLQLPPERLLADTSINARQQANLLNVHTLRIKSGKYLLAATAVDNNSLTLVRTQAFREFYAKSLPGDDVAFSDIKWSAGEMPRPEDKIGKAGREEIIPMVTNQSFFNEDSLVFYQEIYNANLLFEDEVWIRSVIYQGNNRLFNYQTEERVRAARIINVYKEEIPIQNLPSNIYYLQVELFHPKQSIMRTYKQKFYVYNSRIASAFDQNTFAANSDIDVFNKYTEEELDYYLQTVKYQATKDERNFIKVLENYQQKKNFIYSYFERRKTKKKTVRALWNGHLMALKYVNQEFKSTLREGWQTDRGRVLLTYGIPNHVDRHPSETGLIPYEIWRYNRLGPQNNILFVFYDPDLATNEYQLLHSNKYGEINNPRWRTLLDARNKGQTSDIIDYERDRTRYNPGLNLDDN